jgi:hypothetical protein
LPFGKGQRWANQAGVVNQLAGNWQLNGIVRVRSGFPLGPTISPSLLNNTMTNRPNLVCDPTLPHPTPQLWVNTACFAQPAAYQFGNSYRTVGEGPHEMNFDLSLLKDFPLNERLRLQFRVEVFNLLNSAEFDLPSMSMGVPGAGAITATVNDSREIQLGMKVIF